MKPWYQQKTTWAAFAAIVIAVGGYVTGEVNPEAVQTAVTALTALALIFLRQSTNTTQ
jgi:hypothetical protein